MSRLSKASASARRGARKLQLTNHVFDALAYHKLEPIEAQRVVLDEQRGLATAVEFMERMATTFEYPWPIKSRLPPTALRHC